MMREKSVKSPEYQVLCLQYLQMMGLEGLVRRANGRYQFRCPVCGDSKKSRRKMRGWYYPDTCTFHCFNCNHRYRNFGAILENFFPHLYAEWNRERRLLGIERASSRRSGSEQRASAAAAAALKKLKKSGSVTEKPAIVALDILPEKSVRVADLDPRHPARAYVERRRLPHDKTAEIRWCYEGEFAERIIIPMIDDSSGWCYGLQARNLTGEHPKYLTKVVPGQPKIYNIFNVDRSRPVLVYEGIFDSMLADNAVALCGSDVSGDAEKLLRGADLRFVFDNDETGRRKSLKYCARWPVFIWPRDCKFKDHNECHVNGYRLPVDDPSMFKKGAEARILIEMRRRAR